MDIAGTNGVNINSIIKFRWRQLTVKEYAKIHGIKDEFKAVCRILKLVQSGKAKVVGNTENTVIKGCNKYLENYSANLYKSNNYVSNECNSLWKLNYTNNDYVSSEHCIAKPLKNQKDIRRYEMGFFGGLFNFTGKVVGELIGGSISKVGEVVGSDMIKEIGDGVNKATRSTGEIIGQAADGLVEIGDGIITSDEGKINQGFGNVRNATCKTFNGFGNGVANIIENGANLVAGVAESDEQKINESARNLVKTAVIATFAIGVSDIIDGGLFDSSDTNFAYNDVISEDHTGANMYMLEDVHPVAPHYVSDYYSEDGVHVDGYFRDGDGDTSINLNEEQGGGYIRSNPDGIKSNNLG